MLGRAAAARLQQRSAKKQPPNPTTFHVLQTEHRHNEADCITTERTHVVSLPRSGRKRSAWRPADTVRPGLTAVMPDNNASRPATGIAPSVWDTRGCAPIGETHQLSGLGSSAPT